MKIHLLNIGTRLRLGFGAVLLLLAAIIGLGVARLGDLNTDMNKIVQGTFPKVLLAQQILNNNYQIARSVRNAMLETNPQTVSKHLQLIDDIRGEAGAAIDRFDALAKSAKGSELFAAVKLANTGYLQILDQVLRLRAGDQQEAALALLLNNAATAHMLQAITTLISHEHDQMENGRVNAETTYIDSRNLLGALGLAALALGALLAWAVAASITRPLEQAVKLARSVAAGDLSSEIEVASNDETGQLLLALKDMNGKLRRIVEQVRTGTDTIATASNEIAHGNLDLSERTEQQAGALQETAAAMEQITATVRQNGENARQANAMAASASSVASKGGVVVAQVVETMGAINESSKKIVDIIAVIDGIAFQTNILALNAAVEAARAGEQGRGFAVVATEVRNLAQRSAGAAKEIKALIVDSVERVEAGGKLVDEAGATMDEIVASVQRVTDIMGEIACAGREQETGIGQINQAIGQMDAVTQMNSALVEEAAAATAALHEQADQLSRVVGVFKLDAAP
ncbi:MAG: MCP four helix bundle domain-containing protein, partial [Burkholderiaceae bacterium]|nr:MCP four helix bundle domain-containing protein [Burkholderiaceae bacterium]